MRARTAAVAAAVTVVLGAAQAYLINRLDAGWPWWVAAVVVTVALAGLAASAASDRVIRHGWAPAASR
jgi:hypothetical protein